MTMSPDPLLRSHEPDSLSRIGGAAQGGSAKPKQEREALDRKHEQKQHESPAGSDTELPDNPAGTQDQRTPQERSRPERDAG